MVSFSLSESRKQTNWLETALFSPLRLCVFFAASTSQLRSQRSRLVVCTHTPTTSPNAQPPGQPAKHMYKRSSSTYACVCTTLMPLSSSSALNHSLLFPIIPTNHPTTPPSQACLAPQRILEPRSAEWTTLAVISIHVRRHLSSFKCASELALWMVTMATLLPELTARAFKQSPLASGMPPSDLSQSKHQAFLSQQVIAFDVPASRVLKDPKPGPDRLRHRHERSHDVLPREQHLPGDGVPPDVATFSANGRGLAPALQTKFSKTSSKLTSEQRHHQCNRQHPTSDIDTNEQHFVMAGRTPPSRCALDGTTGDTKAHLSSSYYTERKLSRNMDIALSDALVMLDVHPMEPNTTSLQDTNPGGNSALWGVGVSPLRAVGLTPNTHRRDHFAGSAAR
jgi:hypothetical protein